MGREEKSLGTYDLYVETVDYFYKLVANRGQKRLKILGNRTLPWGVPKVTSKTQDWHYFMRHYYLKSL